MMLENEGGTARCQQAGAGTTGTEADAVVSGRIEALKRKFTIARASREAASNAAGQAHVGPHPVMQCPEDSFWKEWQNPPKRPEA